MKKFKVNKLVVIVKSMVGFMVDLTVAAFERACFNITISYLVTLCNCFYESQ